MYANVSYDIDYKDGKYIAKIKPDGKADEAAMEVELDEKKMKKLVEALNKYDISSWNGFQKSDKNVLDGNSFSMFISTKDNKDIEATGYMLWPKNYAEVKGVFDSMIGSLYKGKDIEAEELKYIRFSYSNGGSIANSEEIYFIEKKDDKYIASIKKQGKILDEKIDVEVDMNTIYSIVDTLNEYNVSSWDNFHESQRDVLDGESFSFELITEKDRIGASGYMSWPENYSKVKDKLADIFHSLYEEGE